MSCYDPLVTVHSGHRNAIHVKLKIDGNQGASEDDPLSCQLKKQNKMEEITTYVHYREHF